MEIRGRHRKRMKRERSGSGCDIFSNGLGKSTCHEIFELFVIGYLHVCVQDFVGEIVTRD